jgi:hypothetical protein
LLELLHFVLAPIQEPALQPTGIEQGDGYGGPLLMGGLATLRTADQANDGEQYSTQCGSSGDTADYSLRGPNNEMPLKKPAFHMRPRAGQKTGKFYHRESREELLKNLLKTAPSSRVEWAAKLPRAFCSSGSTLDGM